MAILMHQPIPLRYCAPCAVCGQELDVRDRGIYQRTAGWVMNRAGGGGHGVSMPERENRWAHGQCIERLVKGTINQSTMFGGG